ncbi:MAG: NAD(P)/FAD-dependent oxidoreductase [Chloroflexi bacterium]|nr:NAD(P)/FAD-dependent oxidoreductase [Chloroflexota bacterium]
MSCEADITIVGAGIVGLAIASEVAREGREVYVLEKNETFGQDQSSRNSEVIHAGIYYEPGSLKARLCLEGSHLLYELCADNGIAHRRCGKVMVAITTAEAEELERLYARGCANGVALQMLSRQEMNRLEPNVGGIAAMLSPNTGLVDTYTLVRHFLAKAQARGVHVAYRTGVTGILKVAGGYEVREEIGSSGASLTSRVLINAAGLHSDRVAEMAGIDPDGAGYRLHWCKGEYFSVGGSKNRQVNRLIYPVPMSISVGAHVCLDVNWRMRLGPLFHYVDRLDYQVGDSGKRDLLGLSIMKALPFVEPNDLDPETSGIMAMLQGEGDGFRDFVIRHEHDRGLPGFIDLVGIDSPGMTSSPAIARHVSRLVDEILGG